MATPFSRMSIPVWPVGIQSAFHPLSWAPLNSSKVTVILPVSQSEPTVKMTEAQTDAAAPVATTALFGGFRRSVILT